ncbi:MAG: heme-copper oxidase subunit III [Ardenticatenaceae bacterium]|nr:heme-copper oxidase subunit III [Ardenticatenaceae bacterium]HBY98981.1 hypothetical protein [Chloroflexota bacterium]
MEHVTPAEPGSYGTRVLSEDVRKVGMWIFLSSEVIFFSSLILAALHYRNAVAGGEPRTEALDITLTAVSTFVLLMSSLTMVSALKAADEGNASRLRLWLGLTLLGGTIFLGGQAYEFNKLFHEGNTLQASMSWASFFILTGFHGAHVFVGALLVGSQLIRALRTDQAHKLHFPVELVGLYWHFVDLVWIVIFTVIYLID